VLGLYSVAAAAAVTDILFSQQNKRPSVLLMFLESANQVFFVADNDPWHARL